MIEPRTVSSPGFPLNERFEELAKPKKVEDVWNFSRKLVWGNQETIWPLSPRALTSRPNSRILALAKPKTPLEGNLQRRSLYVYSCGRVSEIWHRPPGLYSIMPSKRTLQLAEPRKYSEMYLKQRPRSSPLWPVTISALYSKASQRILTLAQPRCLLSSFTLPREPQSSVSKAARRATASTRTECLAKPVFKKYPMCYENRFMEAPIREVSLAAQKAVPSPRIVELAKAKMLPAESFPERSPEWPVSVAAKHAVASPRLGELAQPPKRAPTHFVQFDPEAFTVKEAAKKAYCSERVVELAQPITR